MKIIDLKCPNCTAALKVNTSFKNMTCEYCGHTFIIDDEIKRVQHSIVNAKQAGYEFEIGRIQAQEQLKARQAETERRRLEEQHRQLLQQQIEEEKKQEQYRKSIQKQVDKLEQSKWFGYMAVGVVLSIIVPYLLPVVATILIWISPIEKVKTKIFATFIAWFLSIAIIGIYLH